jgi:hypothetical protein
VADIFLSYSREDHGRAEQIAKALTAAGYEVFWDVEIPPGKSWADILEEKLGACKAAIVLWSRISTASKWVREEARLAHDRGKLIPVQIDDSAPPFGFGEIQAANLKHWRGDTSDPHWRALLNAVSAAVARPPVQTGPTGRANPLAALPKPSISALFAPSSRGYVLAAVGVVALIAAIAFRFMPNTPVPPSALSTEVSSGAPATTSSGTTSTAPATLPPVSSTAPDGEARSAGPTRNEVADYLTSLGYKAKAMADANGNAIVQTSIEGTTVNVYFYNCQGERCGEIQFSAGWQMPKAPTPEAVNAWNSQKRLARAYTSQANDALFLEMDLNLQDTTSNKQIDEYLRLWSVLLGSFKKQFAL